MTDHICSGTGASLGQVIAGRSISGIGGAGMTSLVSIIITGFWNSLGLGTSGPASLTSAIDLVPLKDVASWRSYVNIAATTGRSLGGPIGGYLADAVGWRW